MAMLASKRILSCAEFKQLMVDKWCLYCSDPKIYTHFIRTLKGTEIPVMFGGEDDIDFMVSYRWNEIEHVEFDDSNPFDEHQVSTAFLCHVDMRRGARMWVDSLQHLGDRELTERTIKTMGRLYRNKECLMTYYENAPLQDCIASSTRCWMWQESCINSQCRVKYQDKAHEFIHRYIKREIVPEKPHWTLKRILAAVPDEDLAKRKHSRAWDQWGKECHFLMAIGSVGALTWSLSAYFIARTRTDSTSSTRTDSTSSIDTTQKDNVIFIVALAIVGTLFLAVGGVMVLLGVCHVRDRSREVFVQDPSLTRRRLLIVFRHILPYMLWLPRMLVIALPAAAVLLVLSLPAFLLWVCVFFRLLFHSHRRPRRCLFDAERLRRLATVVDSAYSGSMVSTRLFPLDDVDLDGHVSGSGDREAALSEGMVRNLANANVKFRTDIPAASIAVLRPDVDVSDAAAVQRFLHALALRKWTERTPLRLAAASSGPLRDPLFLAAARPAPPAAAPGVASPVEPLHSSSPPTLQREGTALVLRMDGGGMCVEDTEGGGEWRCDLDLMTWQLQYSFPPRELTVQALTESEHMLSHSDAFCVKCSPGDCVVCVGGGVVSCAGAFPLRTFLSRPHHGTAGGAAVEVCAPGGEEGWDVGSWVRGVLDGKVTEDGVEQTSAEVKDVTVIPLGVAVGFRVCRTLSVPCPEYQRATASETETASGALAVHPGATVWVVARSLGEHPYLTGSFDLDVACMHPEGHSDLSPRQRPTMHVNPFQELWRRGSELLRRKSSGVTLEFVVRQLRVLVHIPGARPGQPLVQHSTTGDRGGGGDIEVMTEPRGRAEAEGDSQQGMRQCWQAAGMSGRDTGRVAPL